MKNYGDCFIMGKEVDLSRFKVIYGEKVLNALALTAVGMRALKNDSDREGAIMKPVFMELLAINEDGQIVLINDEAWMFQFLPIVGK